MTLVHAVQDHSLPLAAVAGVPPPPATPPEVKDGFFGHRSIPTSLLSMDRLRRMQPTPPEQPNTPVPQVPGLSSADLHAMQAFIHRQWGVLTVDPSSRSAWADPKTGNRRVYIPDTVDRSTVPLRVRLQARVLQPDPAQPGQWQVKPGVLFKVAQKVHMTSILGMHPPTMAPGLLWEPYSPVVPGARFKEGYGWDMDSMVQKLIDEGNVDKAKELVNFHLFQVEHYGGKVLNANRSYYVGRSSPPYLGQNVLQVYDAMPKTTEADKAKATAWLQKATPLVKDYYQYWHNDLHGTDNGLSRYASNNTEFCPEVEPGAYDHDHADPANDAAERESGWDLTDRYGNKVMDYNPIDLNCLLHTMEKDIARMSGLVGDKKTQTEYEDKAAASKTAIRSLCLDPNSGLYVDYNHQTGKPSKYLSAASFYALSEEIATPQEAKAARDVLLPQLETDFGLRTSVTEPGKQWDGEKWIPRPDAEETKQWKGEACWAPLILKAVQGLRNYGYDDDADRLEMKYLRTVGVDFKQCQTFYEKYNAEDGSHNLEVGYGNQTGFGWTNGTVGLFIKDLMLSQENKRLRQEGKEGVPPLLGSRNVARRLEQQEATSQPVPVPAPAPARQAVPTVLQDLDADPAATWH